MRFDARRQSLPSLPSSYAHQKRCLRCAHECHECDTSATSFQLPAVDQKKKNVIIVTIILQSISGI